MSLWLPRTSPNILRTYSRPQHAIPSHLISAFAPRSHPTASRVATVVLSRRLLSSKASPESSTQQKQNVSVDSAASAETKASSPVPKEPKQAPLMARAWKKVKHEAAHYWHGSKLLVSEVRISARLQWKILHGESLTRRERRQARFWIPLHTTICYTNVRLDS
jgi:LETM1 and EF-hand domain-containing protein 1